MDKPSSVWMFLTVCLFWTAGAERHGQVVGSIEDLRAARSDDDLNPLTPVVNQLSHDVQELQAELQALKNTVTEMTTTVGFSAHFARADVLNLGRNQPVVFDTVPYNAGGGYDKTTGVFTAPASGTYVFALGMQRHAGDGSTVIMNIMKGDTQLAAAEAGYSRYEHGAIVVTTHLNTGDTITVKTVHGTSVFGKFSTIFTGFRISPQ